MSGHSHGQLRVCRAGPSVRGCSDSIWASGASCWRSSCRSSSPTPACAPTSSASIPFPIATWRGVIFASAALAQIVPVYLCGAPVGLRAKPVVDPWRAHEHACAHGVDRPHIGLSSAIIPQNVFTMLVIMAVVTTLMAGPVLQVRPPRAGYRVAHLVRLEAVALRPSRPRLPCDLRLLDFDERALFCGGKTQFFASQKYG